MIRKSLLINTAVRISREARRDSMKYDTVSFYMFWHAMSCTVNLFDLFIYEMSVSEGYMNIFIFSVRNAT